MVEKLTTFPSHHKNVLGSGENPPRRIMHVDMDAYFAALEQTTNPHLRHRPVIVGSPPHHRGVVSTASYECRRFGIHSGMSSDQAYRRCPQAVFIEVDPAHYVHVSSQLMNTYAEFSPTVEAVSVDEAFLDITGSAHLFGGEEALARGLKDRIHAALSLTCSVGIAPNKIMAKIASSVFKPDGLTIIRDEDVATILYPLPVEKMWGIGPAAKKVLEELGITTVGDLAREDLGRLRHRLGKVGEVLGRLARGEDETPVLAPANQPDEKSIGHERTLPHDSHDEEYLLANLHHLADRVGRRMRRHGWRGRTVTVKFRYADFTTLTRRTTLAVPTDDSKALFHVSARLLHHHWDRSRPVRLLGVSVSHLEPDESLGRQNNLWAPMERSTGERPPLDAVVDLIRDRFGEESIFGAYSRHEMT